MLLLAEYELCSDKTDIYPLILLETLGFIYLLTGQLEQAIQIGQVMIQGATHSGIVFTKNWGDYLSVWRVINAMTWKQPPVLCPDRQKSLYSADPAYRDAVAGLALIHQIKGESAEARQMIEVDQPVLTWSRAGSEDSRTHSLRARLQLLQGDLEDASRWVDTFSDLPPDVASYVAGRTAGDPGACPVPEPDATCGLARQILDVLDEIAERTHNTRYKIEILALRALALDAQGEASEAERLLKQALELARPGGFIRVFVDLGIPMQELLRRLEKQDHRR